MLAPPAALPPCRFGGYAAGRRKATGFFRVQNDNGIWWFIDPQGRRFIQVGLLLRTGPITPLFIDIDARLKNDQRALDPRHQFQMQIPPVGVAAAQDSCGVQQPILRAHAASGDARTQKQPLCSTRLVQLDDRNDPALSPGNALRRLPISLRLGATFGFRGV